MSSFDLQSLLSNIYNRIKQNNLSPQEFYNELRFILIPNILNSICLEERDIFIQNNNDSKNGSYNRSLFLNHQKIPIKIPRTRNLPFFPSIIPKYSRYLPEEYSNLVYNLLISSRSIEALKSSIKSMGLKVNESEIDNIVNRLCKEFEEYTTRQIKGDYLFIWIDAKKTEIKDKEGKVIRGVIFTSIGSDMSGKKEVLGVKVMNGEENLDKWREVLLDLKNRGLNRCLLFITDNFSGLTKLIEGLFPMSYHQLCLVHLMRNARYHLNREEFNMFKKKIKEIEMCDGYDDGYSKLLELVDILKEKHPRFASEIRQKADKYVQFLRFPKEVGSKIKSTNQSENINKEIERIRINNGGYFQSENILKAKFYIFIENLTKNRYAKGDPRIISNIEELHRIFRERFEDDKI